MRMVIFMDEAEQKALGKVAERELRGMREQARFILHAELVRLGLLPPEEPKPAVKPGAEAHQ